MAIKPQAKLILDQLLGPLHLTSADLAVLTAEPAQEINYAMASILGEKRNKETSTAVTPIISGGAVSNWGQMTAAITKGDSTTIASAIAAFDAAIDAKNATALFVAAVVLSIATKKFYEKT